MRAGGGASRQSLHSFPSLFFLPFSSFILSFSTDFSVLFLPLSPPFPSLSLFLLFFPSRCKVSSQIQLGYGHRGKEQHFCDISTHRNTSNGNYIGSFCVDQNVVIETKLTLLDVTMFQKREGEEYVARPDS